MKRTKKHHFGRVLLLALVTACLPIAIAFAECSPECPAAGSGITGVNAFSAQCAACEGCDNPSTTCNGEFSIELEDVTRDGSLVTFAYEVCKLGSGPVVKDLSHWVQGLGQITCLAEGMSIDDLVTGCSIGGTPVTCSIGLDPTTQLYAIKFEPVAVSDDNRCQNFTVTLDESKLADGWVLDTGCTTAATKAGNQDITRTDRESPGYACVQGPVCGSPPPPPSGLLQVIKFYDANANSVQDPGEVEIAGWQVHIVDACYYTPVAETFDAGTYTVTESLPLQTNWMTTTPLSVDAVVTTAGTATVKFGNLCLGAGGGKTIGFWSNKNGQAVINDAGSIAPELEMLSGLNLKGASGADFDPATYPSFRSWLLKATAANMAYMLSAQLAAMALNVEAGFVGSSALVYAPGCGNTGIDSNFITIEDLMNAANASLGSDGYTPAGDPNRALQTCLKDALDDANNNWNFVQSEPCPFSFEQPCPVVE